jgi:hypothetical protein
MHAARLIGVAVMAAALGSARAQPAAQSPAPPVASAASQATPSSPSVRAAERARTPGELRPEQPVVPQIAVPLRRDAKAEDAGHVEGGVDERTARCSVLKSNSQRTACYRQGASSAPTASRQAPAPKP